MPSRSIDRFHGKFCFLSPSLWRKYKKETGDNIPYSEFREIVAESMSEIRKWILKEPIGFQIHPRLGNIAINRFKPSKKFKTYLNTPLGPVINHNLHTGGNVFRIQWFSCLTTHKSKQPYWFFKASRGFNRALAATIKGGNAPNYNSYMQRHFVGNGKY